MKNKLKLHIILTYTKNINTKTILINYKVKLPYIIL